MKIHFLVRIKNPYFWVGLIGVILTAMGISADMLTSWKVLFQHLFDLLSNPYMLGSVIMAIIGQIVDPTTSGFGDSSQALEYTYPKNDKY